MTAHCYLNLLGELAITVNHDKVFSGVQFRAFKYQADHPRQFEGFQHAIGRGLRQLVQPRPLPQCLGQLHSVAGIYRTVRRHRQGPKDYAQSGICQTPRALRGGGSLFRCRHRKAESALYRKTPIRKLLENESTSRPRHGASKRNIIFKELVQMRFTRYILIKRWRLQHLVRCKNN